MKQKLLSGKLGRMMVVAGMLGLAGVAPLRAQDDPNEKKAEAIAAAVEGPVTSMITASALQLHPSTRVYLDEEAASQLKMREYFDWVQEKKPGAPPA